MSKTKALDSFIVNRFQQTGLDTLYLYYRKKKWRQAKQTARNYLGKNAPAKLMRRHMRGMRHAYICYGWEFDEYFLLEFNKWSRAGRKEFVPNTQKDYFCDVINPPAISEIFINKGVAYSKFSKYYKRDVCMLRTWEQDGEAVREFIQKHDSFIVKPIDCSYGAGVQIFHHAQEEDLKQLLAKYSVGYVLEELIRQSDKMASLHPQSVNTIRITTLNINGKLNIIHPFFKTGRGESIVDNGAAGGILGVIDMESGVVTEACDEMGNRYVLHPDTKVPLIGFVIPQWKEALALAVELSKVVPEARYIGWDLAHTDEGWVVVEGNSRGMFIGFQASSLQGIRSELESMLGCSLREFCTRKKIND